MEELISLLGNLNLSNMSLLEFYYKISEESIGKVKAKTKKRLATHD